MPLKALFCVNDHKLAREVAATLNEEAPGIAVVWLGLKQPRYADQPGGETMCRRTEDAEMWIEAGGSMETMCARCTIYAVCSGERSFEAAPPHTGAPVETKLRGQSENWSEWRLPRGRFGVTVFLKLPVGTDAGAAKDFLVERAFLPADDVAGLVPKPEGRKR